MSDTEDPTPKAASPWRDVGLVVLVALLAGVLAGVFNVSERLAASTRVWEALQLDELPLVLLVATVGLLLVAERRRWLALSELRARRAAEDRLAGALAANRELSQEHLRLQEVERRRLARELHDELGQTLNAIKLDAVSLREHPVDEGAVHEAARQIVAGVDQAHVAVAAMIARLRPAALDDLGLVAALEACVDAWRRRLPRLRIELTTDGNLDDLGEALNVAVYRLVQEALTNAVRHSGAARIEVGLRREGAQGADDRVCLRVSDAGRGMDPATGSMRGFGLRGLHERVELLHGRCVIRTAPGQGFTLDIELPVEGAS